MPDLLGQLRTSTREVHGRLEADLDILRPPLPAARFLAFVERMHGFHRVWEPSAERVLGPDMLRGRRRMAGLRADLLAMGCTDDEIEELPSCHEAATLAESHETVLGAMYVLEGTTLGGQVITRALRGTGWFPASGLACFDPYGPETGIQWRTFRDALDRLVAPAQEADVVAGALATFEMLHRWLRPVCAS